MRCKEYRHESNKGHSSLFVFCFLLVFVCAAALGSLRLYGLYIENRISETAGRIEACRENNLEISMKFSELLSPAKIYSFAREELAMSNAENIQTIKINNSTLMMAKAEINPSVSTEEGFLDYLNPFVRKAHAKD